MLASSASGMATTNTFMDGKHLLSHRLVDFTQPRSYTPATSETDLAAIHTSSLAEAEYDVDLQSGFLPPQAPMCRLPSAPYTIWEDAWDATSGFRPGVGEENDERVKRWRHYIREEMPVISVKLLQEMGVIQLRRAHSVLAFLTHAYVHSESRFNASKMDHEVVVPRSLAAPLCAVSTILDIPPILTYADTVLYNWRLKVPGLGFTVDNVEIPTTFTRTEDEVHFFKTSLLIEAVGPACLTLMRSSLDEVFVGDEVSIRRIIQHLSGLVVHMKQITQILTDVRTACAPRTFYWDVRPWFNGGRWKMEGVTDEAGECRMSEFGGPSAGQSTLIHSIDLFLGVDHSPHPGEVSKEETFMNRMANYMPHFHRQFLQQLSRNPHQIRTFVQSSGSESLLSEKYNEAILSLEALRNAHSRIALLYIISQSRVEPTAGSAFIGEWEQKMASEWQARQAKGAPEVNPETIHLGTGGTDLARFLRRCRDRTCAALV